MRSRTLAELRESPDMVYFAPAIERLRSMRDFFAGDAPLFIARAPGRLDVMGGIADYSGSLVLQLPLECATTAILQPRVEPVLEIVSLRGGTAHATHRFEMPLDELLRGALRSPERLAAWFATRSADRWASYVVGVVHACLVQRMEPRAALELGGFRLLIESRVPEGKGVSSSAALEVACLSVIAARYGVSMTGEEIATSAQWAENHIAGAPCGIMDQMTSACGEHDRLLRLRCQPGTIEGHVPIPPGYRFYGIDSGIRHAVTGADYGTVRTAAFMGYRIIAEIAGLKTEIVGARARVDDPAWRGYLANITGDKFRTFWDQLPQRISGAEFLARYNAITDVVTHVRHDVVYPVRQATAHPMLENGRVAYFAHLLGLLDSGELGSRDDASEMRSAQEMGLLMYQSHDSYGACGLGSDGTDRLVELVREAGVERELFGAKITGGGSGGTVAVFGTERAEQLVREIAARYSAETGRDAEVFARSGPGAAELGVLIIPGGAGL